MRKRQLTGKNTGLYYLFTDKSYPSPFCRLWYCSRRWESYELCCTCLYLKKYKAVYLLYLVLSEKKSECLICYITSVLNLGLCNPNTMLVVWIQMLHSVWMSRLETLLMWFCLFKGSCKCCLWRLSFLIVEKTSQWLRPVETNRLLFKMRSSSNTSLIHVFYLQSRQCLLMPIQ